MADQRSRSPVNAVGVKKLFENYVRLSQNEKRDIARWWQLEQEGDNATSGEARQEAADSVRTSEGKRLEVENQIRQALDEGVVADDSYSPAGSPGRSEDDESLIQDLQVALQKSELARAEALQRLDELSLQVGALKTMDNRLDTAHQRTDQAQARAALAESKLTAVEEQLAQHKRKYSLQNPSKYADPDDALEERIDSLEGALSEACNTVTTLKGKLEESDLEMLRQRRQAKELRRDKERLTGLLSDRMHQLEDEAMQLQSIAQIRGRIRGRSTSPASRANSPSSSVRQSTRSASHSYRRNGSPSASQGGGGGGGGGGGQGTRLGLEVADSIHVGRLGGDLKYDGVRVVAASRPAAPIIHDGDVIIKVDDRAVTNMQSFKKVVHQLDPHTSVLLTVRRKGPGGTTGMPFITPSMHTSYKILYISLNFTAEIDNKKIGKRDSARVRFMIQSFFCYNTTMLSHTSAVVKQVDVKPRRQSAGVGERASYVNTVSLRDSVGTGAGRSRSNSTSGSRGRRGSVSNGHSHVGRDRDTYTHSHPAANSTDGYLMAAWGNSTPKHQSSVHTTRI